MSAILLIATLTLLDSKSNDMSWSIDKAINASASIIPDNFFIFCFLI